MIGAGKGNADAVLVLMRTPTPTATTMMAKGQGHGHYHGYCQGFCHGHCHRANMAGTMTTTEEQRCSSRGQGCDLRSSGHHAGIDWKNPRERHFRVEKALGATKNRFGGFLHFGVGLEHCATKQPQRCCGGLFAQRQAAVQPTGY